MRRPPPQNPGISLFPFLAVLICTMGVMMLLLVIFNRPGGAAEKIDTDAAEADAQDAAANETGGTTMQCGRGGCGRRGCGIRGDNRREQENRQRGPVGPRVAQLENLAAGNLPEKTAGDLSDQRLRLSSVEETVALVEDQWKQLQQAARDMQQVAEAKTHDNRSIEARSIG